MALSTGARLGPNEILSAIGAGGMGEVYRARDTKLNRDVAIKVLPDLFANDPDRLARFQREAQVLASLNHPNIAHIHGLEDAASAHALVMELVEGEDLAQRIARGPLPLEDALPIARQIAEALEAAHEQGIVHRDLKPANVKVRSDGTVKVLDFGLAKAMSPDVGRDFSPTGGASHSPTITSPAMMTGAGMILGTAAYMAPEQAKGKAVDKRAGIWAFGCVLYEMLTGKHAFPGDDVADVLARILEREPDWSVLPAWTPPAIRRLLRRCLQKDRRRRLPDIGVAVLDIEDASTSADDAPMSQRLSRRRVAAAGLAVLGAIVVSISATMAYVRRPVPAASVTRLEISTPGTDLPFQFALSPDGRQLVYVTGSANLLAVRPLDQTEPRVLAGTDGGGNHYPFWSPDGRSIGFNANGTLRRLDLAGGAPQALAPTPNFRGASWNSDGVIIFAPTNTSGLMRVSANGGPIAEVTHLANGQGGHMWPQFLPDGRHFIFLSGLGQPATQGLYFASLDGGEPKLITAVGGVNATYADPGYLLRVSQGVLTAQHFEAASGTLMNDPVPVAQAVVQDDGNFRSALTISSTGMLAYRSGAVGVRRQLVWFDRSGKVLGSVGPPDDDTPSSPVLSLDERHVANGRVVQGNGDVWVIDVARGVPTRFTFNPATEYSPLWSPDGSRIVFRSLRNGPSDLFVKPANGSSDEQPLLVTPQNKTPLDWSRDGRFLLYSNYDPKTDSDLWVLPLGGANKPTPVVHTEFDETQGQFSPDTRWLAYTSTESGRTEIYVRPFPEDGGKWQVSAGGASQPRWSQDGKEISYLAADGKLTAVPIHVSADGRAVEAGTPVPLFSAHLAAGSNIALTGWQSRALYAVSRDGRFLMNTQLEAPQAPPLIVLQNWPAVIGR